MYLNIKYLCAIVLDSYLNVFYLLCRIFFDPTGEHFFDGSPPLSTNTSDHNSDAPAHIPSTKPQTKKKAVARNYGLSMEMLRQFPDQIEPFSSLPFGVRESLDPAFTGKKQANFHGTLFRLPLRSHESSSFHSFCENIFTKERVMSISHELKKVPTCFLFTQFCFSSISNTCYISFY